MDGHREAALEFLRDTRTGDVFVWVPREGRSIQLRFLDSVPGDPDGVLTYDARTFLRLRRIGALESISWHVVDDA